MEANFMKTKVFFHSRKGNTKKIAEAIADELEIPLEKVLPAYMPENMELMFLGAASYGSKLDKKINDFISFLDTTRVRNAALFSTSGKGDDTAIKIMREKLEKQGINVLDEHFSCKGKMFLFFNMGKPDSNDVDNARKFAKDVIEKFIKEEL